jgi:hypothetical protein
VNGIRGGAVSHLTFTSLGVKQQGLVCLWRVVGSAIMMGAEFVMVAVNDSPKQTRLCLCFSLPIANLAC